MNSLIAVDVAAMNAFRNQKNCGWGFSLGRTLYHGGIIWICGLRHNPFIL